MSDEPTLYAPDEYFSTIERHFGLRCGGPLVLSPRDWQRIERWQAKGIPLSLVLQGINRAFDYLDATPGARRIKSLAYCEPQVMEAWEAEGELAAAAGSGHHANPSVTHLLDCAATCRRHAGGPASETLEKAASALEALAADAESTAPEVLDLRATEIQSTLDSELEALGLRVPLPPFRPWAV